jgi:ethanolamine permease
VSESERRATHGVEYENVGEEYLEHRRLQKGAAGWVLLAGLGVAYVISGQIGGWQFGLAEGGWGGLLIATIASGTRNANTRVRLYKERTLTMMRL